MGGCPEYRMGRAKPKPFRHAAEGLGYGVRGIRAPRGSAHTSLSRGGTSGRSLREPASLPPEPQMRAFGCRSVLAEVGV